MGSNTITIVTGAVSRWNLSPQSFAKKTTDSIQNRGIGLGICQTLISNAEYQPITPYACSREGLDLSLSPSNPKTKVKYATLDITSQESIASLVEKVKSEFEHQNEESRVVLINNAATVITPHNADNTKAALDVNYRGTLKVSIADQFNRPCDDGEADVSSIHSNSRITRQDRECLRIRFAQALQP